MLKHITIHAHERGMAWRNGEPMALLPKGVYWHWSFPGWRGHVDILSLREPWITHKDLDVIVRAGILGDQAVVLELAEHERALVWKRGVFDRVVGPGLAALWTNFHEIRVERLDARQIRLRHEALPAILKADAGQMLETLTVPHGSSGLVYHNGSLRETLPAGQYAFWKGTGDLRLYTVDTREAVLDVSGQDIMTADKVTLRLNAVVVYRVTDPTRAVTQVSDFRQSLYREAQLALRAAVGTRTLDQLLASKDEVVQSVQTVLQGMATALGIGVAGFGIRDVVLPGDMKDLLNKVIEAEKAAQAALITRREETAAMRSQANTARLLENNPTLMRLKELEVIETIAKHGRLSVMLGDKGLSEKLLHLVD